MEQFIGTWKRAEFSGDCTAIKGLAGAEMPDAAYKKAHDNKMTQKTLRRQFSKSGDKFESLLKLDENSEPVENHSFTLGETIEFSNLAEDTTKAHYEVKDKKLIERRNSKTGNAITEYKLQGNTMITETKYNNKTFTEHWVRCPDES